MLKIEAKNRTPGEKLRILRKMSLVPAVLYGAGKNSTPITIEVKSFEKIHRAGESTPVVLKIDNNSIDAMIQDVQYDPLTLKPIHIDFLAIDVNREVETRLPLEFIGEAPAAKSGLGTLIKVMHDITIRALPKDLPHHLEVDLKKLATLEDRIFVSDVYLPKGVSLATPKTEIVALISVIKEEAPTTTEPVDLSSIEIIKKGKKEEEVAEGGATA